LKKKKDIIGDWFDRVVRTATSRGSRVQKSRAKASHDSKNG
jgi:hypothetical protein